MLVLGFIGASGFSAPVVQPAVPRWVACGCIAADGVAACSARAMRSMASGAWRRCGAVDEQSCDRSPDAVRSERR